MNLLEFTFHFPNDYCSVVNPIYSSINQGAIRERLFNFSFSHEDLFENERILAIRKKIYCLS